MAGPRTSLRSWKTTVVSALLLLPAAAFFTVPTVALLSPASHPRAANGPAIVIVAPLFVGISVVMDYCLVRALLIRMTVDAEGIRVRNYLPRSHVIPWSDYAGLDDRMDVGGYGRPLWTVVVVRRSGTPVKVLASTWFSSRDRDRFLIRARALVGRYRPETA